MSCDSLELFLSKHLNLSFQLLTGSGVNKSNSAIIFYSENTRIPLLVYT